MSTDTKGSVAVWECMLADETGPDVLCRSMDANGNHFYAAYVKEDGCVDIEMNCDGRTGRDCEETHHVCSLPDFVVTLGNLVTEARRRFGPQWGR